MDDPGEVPAEIVVPVRAACLALPETTEESAWTGIRWRIRNRTFAHVLLIDAGWPPAYARAADDDGPICVLMFRSSGPDLGLLRGAGRPFFAPVWRADEVGLVLETGIDTDEVASLLTTSYCVQAPRRLAETVRAAE